MCVGLFFLSDPCRNATTTNPYTTKLKKAYKQRHATTTNPYITKLQKQVHKQRHATTSNQYMYYNTITITENLVFLRTYSCTVNFVFQIGVFYKFKIFALPFVTLTQTGSISVSKTIYEL